MALKTEGSPFQECEHGCREARIKGIKWVRMSEEYQFQCSKCDRFYALTVGGRVTRIYLAKEKGK